MHDGFMVIGTNEVKRLSLERNDLLVVCPTAFVVISYRCSLHLD